VEAVVDPMAFQDRKRLSESDLDFGDLDQADKTMMT
jgi:hypothetical protein